MSDTVTIVIPVWNRADLLAKLLASIKRQSHPPEQVLAVDNGSTDQAPEVARRWGAVVLSIGYNAGFAEAVNRGIEGSTTDWVAVVNSDVELDPDWLRLLVASAAQEEAWFAGGKILMSANPGQIDGTFDLVAKSGAAWRAGHGQPDSEDFAQPRVVSLLPATATLYRRELFNRIGLFETSYGSYLEDVDLSLRAAASRLHGLYVPRAFCTHVGSASAGRWSKEVVFRISRNRSLLVRRLFPPELRSKWKWQILLGNLLWCGLAVRRARFGSWLRGQWHSSRVAVHPIRLDRTVLEEVITRSEEELRSLQRAGGQDFYWRLYFLFTGAGSL